MKKIIFAVAMTVAAVASFTGCTVTNQGKISADIVYQVYEKISEKEGSDLAARIEALWIKLDAVESFDQLPAVYKDSVTEIDDLISKVKNPLFKYVLTSVKKQMDKVVTTAITKEVSKAEAQEYLIAFRDEIRTKFSACVTCTDVSACGF